MSMPRRVKLGLGLLGAGVFCAGGLVYPSWRAAHGVKVRSASVRQQLGAIDDRPGELEALRARLDAMTEFAAAHTKPMPTQSDVAGLVRGLSMHLDALGIGSREIATGAPMRAGPVTVMPMTLMMRCDFLSACAVVEHVESLPRLVRVRRFKIERERNAPGATPSANGALKAEILLELLAADAPPAVEAVASPMKGSEP